MLKLYLSSDHATAATGKTVAITLSKAGAAFGNPNLGASNATEVASGWYKFALDTTDTGTLGDLVIRGTSASCDDTEQVMQVVSATTGGATNLDVASSTLATAANLTTVAGYIDTEVATIVTATTAASIRAAVGLASANLDTQLTTIDDFLDTEIAAIKAKTDSLTFTVAGQVDSNIKSVAGTTVNGVGTVGSPWGP